MKVDFSSPIIIGAIITGICALGAALIALMKKGQISGRSASQNATLSSHATQVQAGRDVTLNRSASNKDEIKKESPDTEKKISN